IYWNVDFPDFLLCLSAPELINTMFTPEPPTWWFGFLVRFHKPKIHFMFCSQFFKNSLFCK
ncbi:MAG: hypothetical protein ACREPR_04395, partial [Brasilonema sp.]